MMRSDKMREIARFKAAHKCRDCGQKYPHYVLDLDGGKGFDLSRLLERPLEEILVELQQVEVVCANCHRQRTYERAHPEEVPRRADLRFPPKYPRKPGRRRYGW